MRALHHRLRKEKVEIAGELRETFYNMREFTMRDPNGYLLTLAEPTEGE